MPISKQEQGLSNPEPLQRNVEVGDTAVKTSPKKRTGKPYTPKKTLNLKMKERTGMKPEWFVLALALIMAVALVIEYFGVYRRYEDLAKAEAHLDAEKQKLEQTRNEIRDIEELRAWFNQYSYEGFDDAMQDKIDVLDMLEERIFTPYPEITIRSLNLSRSEISFTVIGLKEGEKEALYNSLGEEKMIERVTMSTISVESGIATVSVRIVLKDKEGSDNV